MSPRGLRLLARVPRLGEDTARAITNYFGELTKLQRATVSDLLIVPGVTTVIGILGENKRALIHSAWKLGSEGKNYREEWGKAASAGTQAHALCQAHMLGKDVPPMPPGMAGEEVAGALARFESFKVWLKQNSFEPVAKEVPIVSERLKYGGSIDCVGLILGKPALIDLKSKSLYKDQIIQVAAYRALWNEAHPDLEIPTTNVHVLGLSDGFHHHMISDSNICWGEAAFISLLEVYRAVKAIKA
jgi:hypothetical protein